jgi:predicted RNase H-like HicB family nuclease
MTPVGQGGITTQAQTLPELVAAISEAVQCHFADDEMPQKAELHFVTNPDVSLLEVA